MRIIRDYRDCPDALKGAVIAIGNFDGLHRGHERILDELLRQAHLAGRPAMMLSFEPHPRRFFAKDRPPVRIQPFSEKAAMLKARGLDVLLAQRFNTDFSRLSAPDFLQMVLHHGLRASQVITGKDFIFGYERSGNSALIAQYAQAQHAFAYKAIEPLANAGEGKFSTSKIREHLRQGEMAHIQAMLGRPYRWCRRVVHGDKRGREMAFPTANLIPPPVLLPRGGVYAVRAGWRDYSGLPAVANLGWRPTVDGQTRRLEVHLLDQRANLYGEKMTVDFYAHLRDEIPFESLDALKQQIEQDCKQAREVLEHG